MFSRHGPLFLAALITLSAFLGVPHAYANHESISIVLQPPKSHVYIHGDQVTTSITIQTGPHFFGHIPVNDKNETRYFIVYKDKLADHPDIPIIVENRTLFVPLNGSITNNYTRPLTEGFWLLTAEVYEDDANGEKLLQTPWQKTIVVQSELYPVFLAQTDATIEAAKASADSAYWSAVSAILGPSVAIGGVIAAIGYERHKTMQDRLAKWREDYHHHSETIITILKEWYDSIQFPFLEYENGSFIERSYSDKETSIDHDVNDHLKLYGEINAEIQELQSDAASLTKQIRELFTATNKDSFQKLIVDKLSHDCPGLARKTVPFGNNGIGTNEYLDSHVFYHIYDAVALKMSGRVGQSISTEPQYGVPGFYIYHYGGKMIASSDDIGIQAFSKAIIDLCSDLRIIALVKEYQDLRDKLQTLHNVRVGEVHNKIVGVYTRIFSGDDLEGIDICSLCPPKPKRVSSTVSRLISAIKRTPPKLTTGRRDSN